MPSKLSKSFTKAKPSRAKLLVPQNPYINEVRRRLNESHTLGKQIVYHSLQDPMDAMSVDDIAAADKEIATLRDAIATVKANEKLLRANLISVNATISTGELRSNVALLELEKNEILERLGPLRAGDVKPVIPEEKAAVDKEWRMWQRKAGTRKKICMELWEMCTEEMPEGKTKDELWVRWHLIWCHSHC